MMTALHVSMKQSSRRFMGVGMQTGDGATALQTNQNDSVASHHVMFLVSIA